MEIISVSGLTKSYNSFTALDNVSFSIKKGEVFSIIGPNGAGKTTLIKIVCGLIKPTTGSISVNIDTDDTRKVIGYMPEESALYDSMKVTEYLRFFAELFDVPKEKYSKRIAELIEFFALPDKEIQTMSKGMRRKVLLARSLINDPELLVFDEPASGLDPVIARSLLQYIRKLRGMGKTIVMTAHDMAQIEEISDRILIMRGGKIELQGTIADIKDKYNAGEYWIEHKAKGKTSRKSFKTREELVAYVKNHKVTNLRAAEKTLEQIFIDRFKNVYSGKE